MIFVVVVVVVVVVVSFFWVKKASPTECFFILESQLDVLFHPARIRL